VTTQLQLTNISYHHIKNQTVLQKVPIATTVPIVYETHTHLKENSEHQDAKNALQRANCGQWDEVQLSSLAIVTECNFRRGHLIVR